MEDDLTILPLSVQTLSPPGSGLRETDPHRLHHPSPQLPGFGEVRAVGTPTGDQWGGTEYQAGHLP